MAAGSRYAWHYSTCAQLTASVQVSIQTSESYSELLGDSELKNLLSGSSEVRHMIEVELALAKAQSAIGMIPANVGADMAAALVSTRPEESAMKQGISSTGVPVPALLTELRNALPENISQWLHWGATSQDIMDTASMLQVAQCLDVLEQRLSHTVDALQKASQSYNETILAGRTRTQLATPITLGLRIAQWAQPLISLENDLAQLRPKVLRLQLGGAVGANTALFPDGPAVAAHMAQTLGLTNNAPWHTDRSAITSLANWLLQICLSLAKMAKDLMIMSRSDIAELHAGETGGSSTMPHKANPIQSEMVVAMSAVAQAQHAGLCAAASPIEERDGSCWTVEWVLLPQLLLSTGCSVRHSLSLVQTLTASEQNLQATLSNNPQLMSEAASFALAEYMPRDEAQALVNKIVCSGKPLRKALEQLRIAPIDWEAVLDPKAVFSPCEQVCQKIFSQRTRRTPDN